MWDNFFFCVGGGWGNFDVRYILGFSWGESSLGRIINWFVLKNFIF